MIRASAAANRDRRESVFAAALVAVVVFSTYGYQLLFNHRTLFSAPGSPWLDSGVVRWINAATAKIVHSMVAGGEWPLWSKLIGIGTPLVPDPQNSFFSPFSIILYFFPTTYGWDFVTLLRLVLLILFSYKLFRYFGIVRLVAVVMAILFGYSGHVFYFLNHFNLNTLVFAPLFLLGIACVLNREYRRALPLIALSIPLMFFGGGFLDLILVFVYGGLVVVAYGLEGLLRRQPLNHYYPFVRLGWYGLIGLLLSSVFLLPLFEKMALMTAVNSPFAPVSQPGTARAWAVFNSHWYLVGMLFNKLAVTPVDKSDYYMAFRQYLHIIALPGFLVGILAVAKRNLPHRHFFLGSLVFVLLYYMKLYDYEIMYFVRETPIIRAVRFEKYQGLLNLGFYFLSAFGFQQALGHGGRWWKRAFFSSVLVTAVLPLFYVAHYGLPIGAVVLMYVGLPIVFSAALYLYFLIRADTRKWFRVGILSFLAALLIAQIRLDMIHTFAERREIYSPSETIDIVRKIDGNYRVFPFTGGRPRTWSAYGVNDVRNISVVFSNRFGKFFKRYVEKGACWHGMILCSNRPDDADLSLAEYLGVRYLVISKRQQSLLEQNSHQGHRVVSQTGGRPIVELDNPTALFSAYDDIVVDRKSVV